MRNIYSIWFVRKVLPGLSIEVGVLAAFAFVAQNFIKFGHIVNNLLFRVSHQPALKLVDFWLAAFSNTELMTKLMLVGAIAVGVFIVRDAIRTTRRFTGNFFAVSRVTL